MITVFLLLFYPNGRCSFQVDGVGLDIFDFIVGVVHDDCLIEGDKCHHQKTYNFGEGQTVVPARFVQWTVKQCKCGQWTITLNGRCACQTGVNSPQVFASSYCQVIQAASWSKHWGALGFFGKSLSTQGLFNSSTISTG